MCAATCPIGGAKGGWMQTTGHQHGRRHGRGRGLVRAGKGTAARAIANTLITIRPLGITIRPLGMDEAKPGWKVLHQIDRTGSDKLGCVLMSRLCDDADATCGPGRSVCDQGHITHQRPRLSFHENKGPRRQPNRDRRGWGRRGSGGRGSGRHSFGTRGERKAGPTVSKSIQTVAAWPMFISTLKQNALKDH